MKKKRTNKNFYIFFGIILFFIILFCSLWFFKEKFTGRVIQMEEERNGLRGEYYSDERLTRLVKTRIDKEINFDKEQLSNDLVKSIRWIGYIKPEKTGEYILGFIGDGVVKIWIDSEPVINSENEPLLLEKKINYSFDLIKPYKIKVEYVKRNENSSAQFYWQNIKDYAVKEIVPEKNLITNINQEEIKNEIKERLIKKRRMKSSIKENKIVINRGGVYSGYWENSNPNDAAIIIKTNEEVIIENSIIKSAGELIKSETNNLNLIIRNSEAYGLNPRIRERTTGRFLNAEGFEKIVIENNYLEGTRGIYILGKKIGGQINITRNFVLNIDGRLSDGIWGGYLNKDNENDDSQFIQLDKVRKGNVEISWNYVINEPYKSRVEDVINIYESSGTKERPIKIINNYIRGAYPVKPESNEFSGGGIMGGDGEQGLSENILVENNFVISTGNYGIASSSGKNIVIRKNTVVSSGLLPSGKRIKSNNVGIYVYDIYKTKKMDNIQVKNNLVGWINNKGKRNDFWFESCKKNDCDGNNNIYGLINNEKEEIQGRKWQFNALRENVIAGPVY